MRNFILTIICSFFISYNFALATEKTKEDFIIYGVQISEVGSNSTEARQKAVAAAQENAFRILVGRLIGNDFQIQVDPIEIETLIESIEIKDESITNQNYAANFTVHFNQNYTTYYLDNKIADATKTVPSVLVIPVLNENGFFKLWQYGNIWKSALTEIDPVTILDVRIPSGDIDDLENFVVENFANYSEESIKQLKQNYGVDKIIVATIFYDYNQDYSDASLSLHLGELGVNNTTLLAEKSLNIDDSLRVNLQDYANLLVKKLDEAWIKFSTLSFSAQKNYQMVVFKINKPIDIHNINAELAGFNFIDSWSLVSLSTRYAGFRLAFEQSPLDLVESLKAENFAISRDGDNLFIIGKD
ncbi:MAG: DUF2066 domain-containing protein [Rickettsiales bacterium]|nr:DUF2066 domain-containing protein [Rickettsiales bacterium]